MFSINKSRGYNVNALSGVAANSLVCESGTPVKIASGFVAKAGAGETIEGIANNNKTYASDNQTVAMAKVSYNPVHDDETYDVSVTGGIALTFDAALVASNTINLEVNGTAMTQVTYATSNDNTLDLIATQLETQFPTLIASADRSGTRSVAITPVAGVTVTLSDIVVAAGASQANGAQVNNLTVGNYYDITSAGALDGMTTSSSTGQLKIVSVASPTVVEVKIVNA